jgi:mRNA interferase HigB
VRVISLKRLREFWTVHTDAEEALLAWRRVAEQARWKSFADVRAVYGRSVDRVGLCYVLNIKGNKYRLIVLLSHDWTVALTCVVLTHQEYDRGQWKTDCECGQ